VPKESPSKYAFGIKLKKEKTHEYHSVDYLGSIAFGSLTGMAV
jgi:hypothetical protein